MTAPERAPLGAALALLLTVTSLAGSLSPELTAVVIAAMSIMVAVGWTELLELPDPLGSRIVIGAIGIIGAGLTLLSAREDAVLRDVAVVAALGMLAAFVQQMLRRDRRSLTLSLTGTVSGSLLVVLTCCWTLAVREAEGTAAAGIPVAAASGLALALLVEETPLRGRFRLPLSMLAAAAVTGLVTPALGSAPLLPAIALGLLLALGAGGVHQLLASTLVAREPTASFAVAAAPVGTVGVVVLMAVRLLS
ncbi:hypothetical protein [Brachybacterium hainanense]|uniref:Permease n=1 Tax=Brachybacterium hainanense TaxID=1541174 RepID=A0ABV6RAD3_9MICO